MENTPRNIVLQVGSLLALYISTSFFITLVFGLINLMHPDPADSYWNIESAADSVRLGIAVLIVSLPTYLVLVRLVNKHRREAQTATYQHLTKWLIYLSLLVGGLVLLGTLATTIYTFLNGEITTRFILKAATIVGVVGLAFHYYLLDARGYWVENEQKSIMFGIGVGLLAFAAIAFGFQHIETPAAVREMKLDEQQVNDLRNIQWQVESYLATSSTSPATLDEAYGNQGDMPQAPEGREAYSYEVTETGFKLCASFSRDYVNEFGSNYSDPALRIKNAENWNYKAGRYCFERTVR